MKEKIPGMALFKNLPNWTSNILIDVTGTFCLVSFHYYFHIQKVFLLLNGSFQLDTF